MRTISREDWEKKHPDYKTTDEDGQRWVLRLDSETGATVLEPVRIHDSESGETNGRTK